MPKIPTAQANLNLPSQVNRAGTGLQQVSMDIGSDKFRAMGNLGKQIGAVGELIYQKKIQQDVQDRKLGENELELKLQTDAGQIKRRIDEAQSPEERINIWNEVTEYNPEKKMYELKGFHSYGDDLSKIDTTDNPVLNRLKALGFTEEGQARWNVNREAYLNSVESYISKKVADAKFAIFKEKTGLVDQGIRTQVRENLIPFEDGIARIVNNYTDNGYPESINAPLREAAIQSATVEYLRDQFRNGNLMVMDDVEKGVYDDEIVNVFKDDKMLNTLKNEAGRAKKSIATEIEKQKKEAAKITKRQEKEAHDSFINDLALRYDSDNPVSIVEIELSPVLTGDEKRKWKEVAKKQSEGIDLGKITDSETERELNAKIREIDSSTTEAEIEQIKDEIHDKFARGAVGGVSRAVRDNLLKKVSAAVKDEERPYNKQLKTAVRDGRERILKGSILRGYDAFSVKRANEFENHIELLLKDKKLEERVKMLTPGNSEYIVDELIRTYKPSTQEKIKERKNSLSDRAEGETIKDYLKRKETKFLRLSDPQRQKAVGELKKRNIKATPGNIKAVVEFYNRIGKK